MILEIINYNQSRNKDKYRYHHWQIKLSACFAISYQIYSTTIGGGMYWFWDF